MSIYNDFRSDRGEWRRELTKQASVSGVASVDLAPPIIRVTDSDAGASDARKKTVGVAATAPPAPPEPTYANSLLHTAGVLLLGELFGDDGVALWRMAGKRPVTMVTAVRRLWGENAEARVNGRREAAIRRQAHALWEQGREAGLQEDAVEDWLAAERMVDAVLVGLRAEAKDLALEERMMSCGMWSC